MLQLGQFRYRSDNLGYVIYSGREAVAVDGGAAGPILKFLERRHLKLVEVLNTHAHSDHTLGNAVLSEETGAPVVGMEEVAGREAMRLGTSTIAVLRTPGHSRDSVCFSFEGMLVSGDTLFNGTVGNCFSGDFEGFFASLKTLMALPGETRVYAGHDYVKASIAFARKLEPANSALVDFRKAYDPACVFSTISQELAVNPYFRFNQAAIVSLLEGKGFPTGTEYERWNSLMQIE